MKKSDYVVVFGGCSLDITYKQQKDGNYPNKPTAVAPGGKGSNQAVAASRAGANVKMITRLGGLPEEADITYAIIKNLQDNGIDTSCVELAEGVHNDVGKIYVAKNGDNEIVRQTGAIDSFYPGMIDKYADVIKQAKFVIAQMKCPKDVSVKLINFCNENNVPIVITPCRPEKLVQSDPQNVELLNKATLVTANEVECKKMFGNLPIEECVKKFPNKLIITLGEKGAMFFDGEKVVKYDAYDVEKVIDSTGAGDTLNGNLIASILDGRDLSSSLLRSMGASTIKIQSETAQQGMPKKEELDKYLEDYLAKTTGKQPGEE